MKTYDSPSTLASRIIKLESALKAGEKRHQDASDAIIENTRQVEEDQKTLIRYVESHVNALKTLEDEFSSLKMMLYDSLQQTMQTVYGVHNQVVEQEKRSNPTAIFILRV